MKRSIFRRLFYTRLNRQRLLFPGFLAFAVAALIAYVATAIVPSRESLHERAVRLRRTGGIAQAEELYRDEFLRTKSVPDLVALVRMHDPHGAGFIVTQDVVEDAAGEDEPELTPSTDAGAAAPEVRTGDAGPADARTADARTADARAAGASDAGKDSVDAGSDTDASTDAGLRDEGPTKLVDPSIDEELALHTLTRVPDDLDHLLEDTTIPFDVRLVGRFLRGGRSLAEKRSLTDAVKKAAAETPPRPWFNYALGEAEELRAHENDAAAYFEREARAYPDHEEALLGALRVFIGNEDWGRVELLVQDPRIAEHVPLEIRCHVAIQDRNAGRAARLVFEIWKDRFLERSVFLSAITALAWAFVCARIGKLSKRTRWMRSMAFLAFALGVFSTLPTLVVSVVEEAKLRFTETGDAGRDMLFFVFGVGVREEVCKLACIAPIIYLIRKRKWGDRLDILTVGAFAGLGFAAAENISYLAGSDPTTAFARFLTANFFHISMTAVLASALDDLFKDSEKHAFAFSERALLVMGLHGVYDFVLTHHEYGGAFVATIALVFLTRFFLNEASEVRGRPERGFSLVHSFIVAASAVAGITYVHAGRTVGFHEAPMLLAGGAFSFVIVIFYLVRALGDVE